MPLRLSTGITQALAQVQRCEARVRGVKAGIQAKPVEDVFGTRENLQLSLHVERATERRCFGFHRHREDIFKPPLAEGNVQRDAAQAIVLDVMNNSDGDESRALQRAIHLLNSCRAIRCIQRGLKTGVQRLRPPAQADANLRGIRLTRYVEPPQRSLKPAL